MNYDAVSALAVTAHFQTVFAEQGTQGFLPTRLIEMQAAAPIGRVHLDTGHPAAHVQQKATLDLHRQDGKDFQLHW